VKCKNYNSEAHLQGLIILFELVYFSQVVPSVSEHYYCSLISKQLVFFCPLAKGNSRTGNFKCHRLFLASSPCACWNSSWV